MAKAPKTFESRKSLMLNVLQGLCRERVEGSGGHHPPPEQWPKTRELADKCGENIYTTRTPAAGAGKGGQGPLHPPQHQQFSTLVQRRRTGSDKKRVIRPWRSLLTISTANH